MLLLRPIDEKVRENNVTDENTPFQ